MMSNDAFWTQVSAYNEATWPISLAMLLAAAFLTCRVVVRPGRRTDLAMKGFLSIAFAWNGIVFFLSFARNPISTFIGGPLFLIIALLFAVDIGTGETRFRLPKTAWKRVMTGLWIGLALLYPVIGWPLGHVYPRVLLPLFPCPLTVFAIALVAAAAPKVDKKVFIALLPWALMALPKCFGALDCYEDAILFAAGVYGLVELVRCWKSGRADARRLPPIQPETGR